MYGDFGCTPEYNNPRLPSWELSRTDSEAALASRSLRLRGSLITRSVLHRPGRAAGRIRSISVVEVHDVPREHTTTVHTRLGLHSLVHAHRLCASSAIPGEVLRLVPSVVGRRVEAVTGATRRLHAVVSGTIRPELRYRLH